MEIFKHKGREYIELPKTADGEYIYFEDYVKDIKDLRGKVKGISARQPDCVIIEGVYQGEMYTAYRIPSELKKCELEVFDADGIPIKPGDVVYNLTTGEGFKVHSLCSTWDGVPCFRTEDMSDNEFCPGNRYSHEIIDTQMKIYEDAQKSACEYFGNLPCHECMDGFEVSARDCEVAIREHLLERQQKHDKRKYGGK